MDELLKEFEPLFKKYIDDINLSPMMVYMIDLVEVSALPYLAKQFNVDGYRGWDLATTEADQRELLKKAIRLRSKVGTPWAIKNALMAIGFPNVTINERVSLSNTHNGAYLYNGKINHSGGGGADQWVNFSVTINVSDPDTISSEQRDLIKLLINEYKPARSVLTSLNIETYN